jgi:patatin-like phospholipase/acyl hydrolase
VRLEKKDPATVRILVIDGGGIYGIMPLVVLHYLEEKTGKPIVDLFDFFTGSSTGSIILAALNIPDEQGKPKYSAKQLIELYENVSKEVLTPSLIREIFTLYGLLGPHLSIEHLHAAFLKLLGNKITFGGLLKKVAITAYDIERKYLVTFVNWRCDDAINRYLVADVITAASAYPTFFAPVIFTDYHHQTRNAFIDGGVFADNPSLDAIREALKMHPHAQRFVIVHLGTGEVSLANVDLNADKIQHWGFLHWIQSLIKILISSQITTVKNAITSIQDFSTKTKFEYYYFNKNMRYKVPFDVSTKNIENIKKNANQIIKEQRQTLDKVAQELLNAS